MSHWRDARISRIRASVSSLFLLLLFSPTLLAAQVPGENFNGGRAFADLKQLVSYGPRPAGSPALAQARRWMVGELKQTGAEVIEDSFTASTPRGEIPMTNVIARFPGEQSKVVIVAGHYDTKLYPNDARNIRFVGANDGASSAAFILELARVLAGRKHELTYWLVLFDGEEAVREAWGEGTDSTYGSRHMVQKLTSDGELGRIQAMILVDMIADPDLDIHREVQSTKWLTDLVFNAAHRLGYTRQFLDSPVGEGDDHISFVNAGVAATDLLDLDYGPDNSWWHSPQDTVDHCSPLSMTIVGRTVVQALADLDKSPHVK